MTRRNPPPLYRAIGIDSSGRRRSLGTGPLAGMKNTAMAEWLADTELRSAYVLDRLGNSYLTLEPRDRRRLNTNRGGERLDSMERELEHELTQAWYALHAGDMWRAQDGLVYIDLLSDFATPSQQTEIRSLRAAIKQAGGGAWHEDGMNRNRRRRRRARR